MGVELERHTAIDDKGPPRILEDVSPDTMVYDPSTHAIRFGMGLEPTSWDCPRRWPRTCYLEMDQLYRMGGNYEPSCLSLDVRSGLCLRKIAYLDG